MSTSKMSMLWCDVVAFCLCFIFAVVVGLTRVLTFALALVTNKSWDIICLHNNDVKP